MPKLRLLESECIRINNNIYHHLETITTHRALMASAMFSADRGIDSSAILLILCMIMEEEEYIMHKKGFSN